MEILKKCAELALVVRDKKPLVHHITNYVTVNDCANITLAIGGSPIMADAIGEAADIAAKASALVINIGTLNERTIPSMIAAGVSAGKNKAPVILDPVGAGASKLRNDACEKLLAETPPSVLRGNISEIRFIAGLKSETRGVDASEGDLRNTEDAKEIAAQLAKRLGCVVVITGATDVVSDGVKTLLIDNGHPVMSGITGTGCMCSSVTGAFCGASPGDLFTASAAALLSMGIAGELAFEASKGALGSFRTALIDAVSRIDGKTILKYGKIRES